jgi:hypothetical protein
MNLENYKGLISNLPVRQQSCSTKRSTWKTAETEIVWLADLNNKLFENQKTLNISQQDIFNSRGIIRELILRTFYWGYPNGMRGNHFVNILQNIQILETTLNELKRRENLTSEYFDEVIGMFKKIPGIQLSTYSKLLYFLGIKINGNPCVILDQRLISVLASKAFDDFSSLSGITYNNAQKNYCDFLNLVNQKSIELGTQSENIEQFLFIFGNYLKDDKIKNA